MGKLLLSGLKVEDKARSERVILRHRGPDVRSNEIALDTPKYGHDAEFVVHSPARDDRVEGIAAYHARLRESEVLQTKQYVDPRIKAAITVHGKMRSPSNKKRLRSLAGSGPRVAESRGSRAFQTKPIIEISGDLPFVAKVVKFLAQDIELQVLESPFNLPCFAVYRNKW